MVASLFCIAVVAHTLRRWQATAVRRIELLVDESTDEVLRQACGARCLFHKFATSNAAARLYGLGG